MLTPQLTSAIDLARQNGVRFPNESTAYRHARDELLAEEIELRRHIERVAAQRRALPPGGTVPKDYAFVGENGPVSFSALFGDKQTLAVYSYMYGPQRARPCPMCTSLMAAWDGESLDVEQRIALVMVARSPIERLLAVKKERGWQHLRLYSDMDGDFTRDYATTSAPTTRACRGSLCSPGATEASATSGAARWAAVRPIRDRIREVLPTSCRSGRFSTTHPRDVAAAGTRA